MCGREHNIIRNFGFRGATLEDFTVPRCPWPGQPASYVAYRVFIAVYQCSWNVIVPLKWNDRRFFSDHTEETDRWKWFIYISNWSFTILSLYFLMAAISNVFYHIHSHCQCRRSKHDEILYADSFPISHDSIKLNEKCKQNNLQVEVDPPSMTRQISNVSDDKLINKNRKNYFGFQIALPWYFKVTWILQSCAFSMILLITVMFWTVEFDADVTKVTVCNVHVHGVALFLILIDVFVTASPVRYLHFVYPTFVVIIYSIFTYIYNYCGGLNEYGNSYLYKDWVDWKDMEKKTSIVAVCATFVAVPIAHAVHCVLFLVRKRMFRCYEKKYIL